MPKITLTIDITEQTAQDVQAGRGLVLLAATYIDGMMRPPRDAVPTAGPGVQWEPVAYLRLLWDLEGYERVNERISVEKWALSSSITLSQE